MQIAWSATPDTTNSKSKMEGPTSDRYKSFYPSCLSLDSIALMYWLTLNAFTAITLVSCFSNMLIMEKNGHFKLYNIIQIHNNVLWDWQYFMEYFYVLFECGECSGISSVILSVPLNIVMDLNNVIVVGSILVLKK